MGQARVTRASRLGETMTEFRNQQYSLSRGAAALPLLQDPPCSNSAAMMRRRITRPGRSSAGIRVEAMVMIAIYKVRGAWIKARDQRRAARKVPGCVYDLSLRRRERHWSRVMHEIGREIGAGTASFATLMSEPSADRAKDL